jgi:hypothetical protein
MVAKLCFFVIIIKNLSYDTVFSSELVVASRF